MSYCTNCDYVSHETMRDTYTLNPDDISHTITTQIFMSF